MMWKHCLNTVLHANTTFDGYKHTLVEISNIVMLCNKISILNTTGLLNNMNCLWCVFSIQQVCSDLYCGTSTSSGRCTSAGIPAAPGTHCGTNMV